MKFIRYILGCLFFIIFVLPADAQKSQLEDAEKYIEQHIKGGELVGVFVGYVSADGEAISFSKGTLDIDGNNSITGQSIFEIGSISKIFTTLLLAQLMEEQGIFLDDEAEQYLPEGMMLPDYEDQEILVRHLITHTSGLPTFPDNLFPEDSSNPYADYTFQELNKYLREAEITRTPGSQFEYSNMGMALVGHILEAQTGKEYEQLVIERITEPLKMSSTKIKLTPTDSSRLAKGHARGKTVSNWDLPVFEGAGALRSTGADMMAFLKAQLEVEGSKLYPDMKRSRKPLFDIEQGLSQQTDKIGMGWFYATDRDTIIWHSGGTGGYRTFIGINKETGEGAVVLSNSTADISDLYFYLLDNSYKLRNRNKEKNISLSPGELERFAGEYETSMGLSFYVTNESGKLFIRLTGQNKAPVKPISRNIFVNRQLAAEFTFDTTRTGSVSKLTLRQRGQQIPAKKVSDTVSKPKKREIISVDESVLKQYVGTYQLTPMFSIKVTLEDGQLYAQATGQQKFPIFPESKTKFFYKVVEAQLEFIKKENGEFSNVKLYQSGRVLEGTKAQEQE